MNGSERKRSRLGTEGVGYGEEDSQDRLHGQIDLDERREGDPQVGTAQTQGDQEVGGIMAKEQPKVTVKGEAQPGTTKSDLPTKEIGGNSKLAGKDSVKTR